MLIPTEQGLVIPAKAGIHKLDLRGKNTPLRLWIPAFAGMTEAIAGAG